MLDLCTASFVLGGVDLKSCDIKILFWNQHNSNSYRRSDGNNREGLQSVNYEIA